MKTSQRLRQYFLLAVDLVVLFAALFATLWIRRGLGEAVATYGVHVRYFSLIFAVWVFIYYVAGFYDLETDFDEPKFLGKILWTSFLGALLGALYFYLDAKAPIGPKTVLALDALATSLLVWLWCSSYARVSRVLNKKRRIAFIGKDPALEELVAELRQRPSHGYESVAFYDDSGSPAPEGGLREFRDAETFVWMARGLDISLVVISDERALSEQTRTALISLMGPEIRFMRLDYFYDHILEIPIGTISDSLVPREHRSAGQEALRDGQARGGYRAGGAPASSSSSLFGSSSPSPSSSPAGVPPSSRKSAWARAATPSGS